LAITTIKHEKIQNKIREAVDRYKKDNPLNAGENTAVESINGILALLDYLQEADEEITIHCDNCQHEITI